MFCSFISNKWRTLLKNFVLQNTTKLKTFKPQKNTHVDVIIAKMIWTTIL